MQAHVVEITLVTLVWISLIFHYILFRANSNLEKSFAKSTSETLQAVQIVMAPLLGLVKGLYTESFKKLDNQKTRKEPDDRSNK